MTTNFLGSTATLEPAPRRDITPPDQLLTAQTAKAQARFMDPRRPSLLLDPNLPGMCQPLIPRIIDHDSLCEDARHCEQNALQKQLQKYRTCTWYTHRSDAVKMQQLLAYSLQQEIAAGGYTALISQHIASCEQHHSTQVTGKYAPYLQDHSWPGMTGTRGPPTGETLTVSSAPRQPTQQTQLSTYLLSMTSLPQVSTHNSGRSIAGDSHNNLRAHKHAKQLDSTLRSAY